MCQLDNLFSPFDPFSKMQFTGNQCFLCGRFLFENFTVEHIIPRWILRRFDLFDQRMNLLNGTSIPYRNLTIPCCDECNTVYLSRIESVMEAAVREGPDSVKKVNPMTLYVWMGKIFYGMILKDLNLLLDRKDPSAGYLQDTENIKGYSALHGFLQSARAEIRFEGFFPGSIFVFEINIEDDFPSFDFADNPIGMTIFLRLGNIGLIACLKDDGKILLELEKLYRSTQGKKIQPIQFDEFSAIIFYRAVSMIRTGNYVGISSEIQVPILYSLPGYSLKPYFSDWDFPLLAKFLAAAWEKYGLNYDDIYKPPYMRTYLQEFEN